MNTVKAQPLIANLTWNKLAAIVAWGIGAFTTYLFISALMPVIPIAISIAFACIGQWILTIAERPLWKWVMRRANGRNIVISAFMTIVDGLLNAAGIYPHMAKLANTNVGQMLADVFAVQNQMNTRSSFVIALLIGLSFASLPEALWEQDSANVR